jgi:hypothetical protein
VPPSWAGWCSPSPSSPCAAAARPDAAELVDEGTITIGGKFYAVEPMPFDREAGVEALYAITSEDGDVYHVSDHRDEPARCTRGDFTWRRDGIDPLGCKHIRALVELDFVDNSAGREMESIRTNGSIRLDEARAETRATYRRNAL